MKIEGGEEVTETVAENFLVQTRNLIDDFTVEIEYGILFFFYAKPSPGESARSVTVLSTLRMLSFALFIIISLLLLLFYITILMKSLQSINIAQIYFM